MRKNEWAMRTAKGASAARRDPRCGTAPGSIRRRAGHCNPQADHNACGAGGLLRTRVRLQWRKERAEPSPLHATLPHEPWCRSMTLEPVPPIPLHSSPGAGVASDPVSPPPAALEQHSGPAVSVAEPVPRPGALDGLFALFVSALAFLLASTPARNSDLWLHLASGRLLIRGQSLCGIDPFASTTTGVFWVNHTWLSDALLYEVYERGDGRALVVAKSVLAAVLAGLFF